MSGPGLNYWIMERKAGIDPLPMPDGGEKWLLKNDGQQLAPIRGFDSAVDSIIQNSDLDSRVGLDVSTIGLRIVGERGGLIHRVTDRQQAPYPDKNIRADILTVKDYIVAGDLEGPYETKSADGGWMIKVNGEWIEPVFGVDFIEANGARYEYVDGRLADGQKRDPGRRDATRRGTEPTPASRASAQQRQDATDSKSANLTGMPTPDRIPRAPDISFDYDALTEQEPIGGGGSAAVSKATLPTPDGNVTVALKRPRIDGTLHTDAVEQLLEEAETWDKLDDHSHIVGVVDYSSEPVPWIAMEYMDGGHLGERSGELGMSQALWTALAVTKGVRHAHRNGVAHLDLKPQNILFRTVDDAWDVPKVADWGLSKHLLEHSGSADGITVAYAAPEQFGEGDGRADDITDIYQLGAVFYELFTGQPPFDGQPFEVIDSIKTDRPTPPSAIAAVPDTLDEILLTALAKEKADRYDDIIYLRDALQELFDDW